MVLIDNSQLPNWADFLQVIIAAIGMIAAIIGAYKLIARDRQREAEIKSLSNIAKQLGDLQVLNEKRYVDSKIPHLQIQCRIHEDFGSYFLFFKNINPNAQITQYSKEDSRGYKFSLVKRGITDVGNSQEFSFGITAIKKEDFYVTMKYIVDGKYQYSQELYIYYYIDKYVVDPHSIFYLGIDESAV
ncbi:hypothetical protein LRS05_13675 [Flavobacterium sp. J372]|uniref:hypothetical protein n=1 Tax=Flavobacterium sp. J372 TaxID=2898436 RepID=UPI002150F356|nr:hypothetical protein [Flavobacterium sp. J372]MCR5863108.1 hypothetical protein [Flavobacterium sp. J372]